MEQTIKVELSLEKVQKLYDFLGRVDLKGAEAPALVDILNEINMQYKEKIKEVENNKKEG